MHESVKLLKDLIGFRTENPPGNEQHIADYVKKYFKKHKIRFKTFSKIKGRENLVGFIGKGKPSLLVSCHSDTVPAGDGWKTNPFKAVVKNGRVYGRGAVDDKGPLACLLVAAKELKKVENELKGTLLVGCVVDEERGSSVGLGYLIKEKKIKPDFAIMPDVGESMRIIDIAEKGILHVEVVGHGKAAHGSRPQDGVNAISQLMKALLAIEKYTLKHKKHKLFSKPTINLGLIEGGDAPNMVPSVAKAVLDIRYLPSQSPRKIVQEIKKVVSGHKFVEVKQLLSIPPTEIKGNSELVKVIKKTTKKVLGFTPKTVGLSGATDAKALILKGIPAVGFSCGEHDQMHVPNESIKIKELGDFSKVLFEVVRGFLK